jgi:protein disulfide-isomerase A1
VVSTADELEALKNKNEVLVLGVFPDPEGAERKAFTSVASRMDDVVFAEATSDAAAVVGASEDVSGPAVVLFKDFDEGKVVYDGDSTSDADIETFVAGNQLPLVVEFSQAMAPKIFGGPVKTHCLFFADSNDEATEGFLEGFRKAATEYRGSMLAIHVPETQDRVMEYFGLSAADMPTAVMVSMPEGGAMKKYMYTEEDTSADNLLEFSRKYFDGELKPFLKSDEVPANNDEPVKVVVGKNFEDVVFDETKDVLVEFYAPWCGHCKALAPTYESLGERFEGIDSVVIAKMDATANEVDHPDVNVRGFPTLKFFPGGDKNGQVLDYDGDRELDAFVSYIEDNAAIKFNLPEGDDEL